MVDLVKIRNKKKRNAEVQPAEQAPAPSAPAPESLPEPPPGPAARGTSTPLSAGAAGSVGEDAGAPTKLDRFKAEAGKRRAFEAAKTDDTAPQNQLELLTFVMAGE